MKTLLILLSFLSVTSMAATNSFFDLTTTTIDGKPAKLDQYKGKVVLAVNTASECGYTPQYKDLQALYDKYKTKGLVVLGFPSNDFGGQEPGSNASIKKFCELKYKVSFPMFSKLVVKGDNKDTVYQFLTTHAPTKGEVGWNFEKFLIGRDGAVVGRYKSSVTPTGDELTAAVEKELGKTI